MPILSTSYMEWLKHHVSQLRVIPPLSPSLWPISSSVDKSTSAGVWKHYNLPDCFDQFPKNVLRWTLSIWSSSSVLAGCAELSLACGPVGRKNIQVVVDTSRRHSISVSFLSLSLLLHSLQPVLILWSCTLLSAGSSESCCFLEFRLRKRTPSSSYSHSPAPNSGSGCG